MIHQGHIFNISDSEICEMRCVRVGYDPRNVFPLGSKAFVNAESYDMIKRSETSIRESMSSLLSHSLDFGVGIGTELETHSLFPVRSGNPTFAKSIIDIKNLRIVDGKRLYNLHYIKPTDKFNERSMEYVLNYINRFGAITLKFTDYTGAADFIAQIKPILNTYKYNTTFGSNFQHTGNDFHSLGKSNLFVTFMDVRYCVPIWNPKKVDGIGILIQLISDGAIQHIGHPLTAFTTSIIMTNFMENVFKVDGCDANPMERLGDDVIGTLLSLVMSAKQYEKDSAGKQGKAKAKEEPKKAYFKFNSGSYNKYATISYDNSGSTSSTTTSYYTTS